MFKGDEYAKKSRLESCIFIFQSAKMKEDGTIRGYFRIIYEIVVGIRSCGGTRTENETVWNFENFDTYLSSEGTND